MAAKPIKPLEMCYPCNDPVFNNKLYFTHSLFKKKKQPKVLLWKRIKCFPHYDGGFNKRNNHRSFWICLKKTQPGKSPDYSDVIVFEKLRFPNVFRPNENAGKAGVFWFLRFENRSRKAPFTWRINLKGRPNRRNIAAFSNFSGVMFTRP